MKKLITLLAVLLSTFSFAQSVNDYKYVLVPSRFTLSKESNPYGLSAVTKALLEKYGFVVYLDSDPMPDEVRNFNCNKLYADLVVDNSLTNTKMVIVLKDCKNNILYQSKEGKSRAKDWKVGYHEALRDAAKSFDQLHYKYNGSVTDIQTETVKTTNNGTSIKKETIPTSSSGATQANTLFAQPIANGFQLIDNAPKVIMKIFTTNSASIFIAEKDSFNGVLRQENGNWFFEYYNGNKLISEPVSIKF